MSRAAPRVYLPSEETLRVRRLLFRPCSSQEELQDWLVFFLDMDLPDKVVDPASTTSPFGLIWEVYQLALSGGSEHVTGTLAYASRGGFKTVAAAVLEILMLFHAERDVVHLAAIEKQSLNAQRYVRNFLARPHLKDFVEGDNKRQLEIVWFEDLSDPTSRLTKAEFESLTDAEAANFQKCSLSIEVTVCTDQGVQGLHSTFFVCDELDVVKNPQAYRDAKLIPSERRRRGKTQTPVTLMISTRKSGAGLVQQEIDEAEDNDVVVHHWNILDVTERCPSERHRPDLPKLRVFVDDKDLRVCTEAEYGALPETKRAAFTSREAYAGCLTNCKIFAQCCGHLAKNQTSQALSLKSVGDTQRAIRALGNDADTVSAQCLSRKPSSEDLVYPRLDEDVHLVTIEEFGARFDVPPNSTVEGLVHYLRQHFGARVGLGIDFGFTHNFAVTAGLILPPFCLIFDAVEVPQLEEVQQIALCKERFGHLEPDDVWADPAYPGATSAFRSAKFRVHRWSKKPGSVAAGIEIVRTKLRPLDREPELLFLSGVQGVKVLFERMRKYRYRLDAAGELTDVPEDTNDDGPDSCRYLVMNAYPVRSGQLQLAASAPPLPTDTHDPRAQELAERARRYNDQILQHVGVTPTRVVAKGRLRLVT